MKKSLFILSFLASIEGLLAQLDYHDWHHPLSYNGGGYWKSRCILEIQNLTNQDSRGVPIEISIGRKEGQIDLVGQFAESVRVCDSQGRELLFDILDAKDAPKRVGRLSVGDRLFFATEIPGGSRSRYFVYYNNQKAKQVADFLRVGLENGDFEAGDNQPMGWEQAAVDQRHSVSWVTENPHSGKHCGRTDVVEGAEPTWVKWQQGDIPVRAGVKYVLRGWVKAENVKGYAGWFIHVHGETPMLINRVLNAGGGTYDWKEITFEFETPPTASTATVGTVLYGTGTAWFDDVSLKPIEPLADLKVVALKQETMTLKAMPLPLKWVIPNWEYKTIVKAFNFSDKPRMDVLIFADLRRFKTRLVPRGQHSAISSSLSVQVIDPIPLRKKLRRQHFRLKEAVIFLADLPPKSIKTFVAYLRRHEPSPDKIEPMGYSQIVNSSANLVRNGDFEEGNEMPIDWQCSPSKEEAQVVCIPKRVAEGFVGEHCLQLEIPEGAPLRWSGWHQKVSVKPNTTYLYSGFLKTKDVDGTVTLYGHFKDVEDKTIGYFGTEPQLSGHADWTHSYTFIRTPPECAAVELHLTMNAHGIVWHDGIALCEVMPSLVGNLETRLPVQAAKRDYWVWEENPIIKVFPDDPIKQFSGAVKVCAAKNEYEPVQIVLRSQKDLHNVKVSVSQLSNNQGAFLPPVQINLVGYVPIDHPSAYYWSELPPYYRRLPTGMGSTDGWAGEWPDPLMPYSPFEVKAERNQPLWFTLRIPEDAQAGDYTGKIVIEPQNAARTEIPLQVTVWDFQLPKETHLKVIFDMHRTESSWYKLMAEHRICPGVMPQPKISYKEGKVELDATEFDKWAHYCFDELRMNVFYTPWVFYGIQWAYPPMKFMDFEPFTKEYNEAFTNCYKAFMQHLKEKGWHDKIVYYISDEPDLGRKEVIDNLRKLCDLAHSADKDVPIYSSTWRYAPELAGYLDIWGIGQYGIFTVEQIKERLQAGDELWFTTDGQMAIDTPYLATERLLPYLCFKYGVSGYEFWGLSWWTYNPFERGWHKYILQSHEGEKYGWVRYPNGDGYLAYPGEPLGLKEPVSSIRLEQVREGIEDYEYLHLLREAIQKAKNEGITTEDAEKALEQACDLVSIPNAGGLRSTEILPNPDVVLEARLKIAEHIVKITKNLMGTL